MQTNAKVDRLLTLIQQGDRASFHELYLLLKDPLYLYIFSILRHKESAEDVLQDTFLQIATRATLYRPGRTACAWVYRIARNLAYNAVRKTKQTVSVEDQPEPFQFDSDLQAIDDSSAAAQYLSCLTETEREIVAMHVYDGLKFREIALILDQPISPVRAHYSYAIKKLRKFLNKERWT